MKDKRQYWYVVETTSCVLCGAEKTHRYRVYEKPEQKYIWKENACNHHF